MNKLSSGLLVALLAVSGCAQEQTVFGVRESVWNRLTPAQQDTVMLNYQRQQLMEQQQASIKEVIDSATGLIKREQDLRGLNKP